MYLFNSPVLKELLVLYQWPGPKHWKRQPTAEEVCLSVNPQGWGGGGGGVVHLSVNPQRGGGGGGGGGGGCSSVFQPTAGGVGCLFSCLSVC